MPEGCWRFQCWCELQIFANEPVKNSSWCIPVFWNFPWFFTAELSEQMSGDAQSLLSAQDGSKQLEQQFGRALCFAQAHVSEGFVG